MESDRGRGAKRQAQFLATAQPGVAKIVSVEQPANIQVNNQPLFTFHLEIIPTGGAPYTLTLRNTVPALAMSQIDLTPGSELPVKIGATNPNQVMIDWNAAHQHQKQSAGV